MVTKFAGVFKRLKNIGKTISGGIGKALNVSSKIGNAINSYAKPIIEKVPMIGSAMGYIMDKVPQITSSMSNNFERISQGENVFRSTGQSLKEINEILPANPIGFGYNLKTSLRNGGVQGVTDRFGAESKVFLNSLP